MGFAVYNNRWEPTGRAVDHIDSLTEGEYLYRVRGWIHNPDYNYLIIKIPGQSLWECCIKGFVRNGETGQETVVRYAYEMYGISLLPEKGMRFDEYRKYVFPDPSMPFIEDLYVFEYDGENHPILGLDPVWVSHRELGWLIRNGWFVQD